MDDLSFLLVVISAMAHGYWNFLFKQADNKDAFLGLSKMVEPLIFLGPFLFMIIRHGPGNYVFGFVAVAALLSIANYLLLANAYKRLDLALAYPICRSSTLFLPFLAYLFFGEVIDAVGWVSVIIVSVGVAVIQKNNNAQQLGAKEITAGRWGILFAVSAAFTVALYTLWGRAAVMHMHPFIYMYLYTLATTVYFIPSLARMNRETVKGEWRANKWKIITVAFFNTFSYVLMLVALSMSKVAYVGALRQLSLVFGVTLGWLFLQEKFGKYRIIGLICIVVGASFSYFAK
jgi:drug/metabolite transporter (DMT)-like permease